MKLKRKKREKMSSIQGNLIAAAIISTVIFGVFCVSYIRKNSLSIFPVSGYIPEQRDAEEWINALQAGNEELAILYASKIVPDDEPTLPAPDYMHLLQQNKLNLPLLTSPFNHFDYLRWKDAYEIRKIVNNAVKTSKQPISLLFEQLLTKEQPSTTKDSMSPYEVFQIKLGQSKEKPYTSMMEIWKKGDASLDELFRLFSAMTHQLGYDVVIVCMYDSSFKLIDVLCEIRKDDKSFVCDPVNHKLWKNTNIEKLIIEQALHKDVGKESLNAVEYLAYNLPAESMDYKLYNQQLQERVSKLQVADIPYFGLSPRARMDNYVINYGKKTKKSRYSYWNFPFKSLKSSTEFPKQWHSLK